MRGAAAPRTPRLKRKDTLHAYRVAANATDFAKNPPGRVGDMATCLLFSTSGLGQALERRRRALRLRTPVQIARGGQQLPGYRFLRQRHPLSVRDSARESYRPASLCPTLFCRPSGWACTHVHCWRQNGPSKEANP